MAKILKKDLEAKVARLEAENDQLLSTLATARTEYKKLVGEYNAVVARLNKTIALHYNKRKAATKKAA